MYLTWSTIIINYLRYGHGTLKLGFSDFQDAFFSLASGLPSLPMYGNMGMEEDEAWQASGSWFCFPKIRHTQPIPNYQFSLTTLTSTWEWHIVAIPHTVGHTLISQASIGSTMASLQCVQVSFLEMSSADEIANCSRSCKQTHRRPSVTSPKQGFDGLGQHLKWLCGEKRRGQKQDGNL